MKNGVEARVEVGAGARVGAQKGVGVPTQLGTVAALLSAVEALFAKPSTGFQAAQVGTVVGLPQELRQKLRRAQEPGSIAKNER